MGETSRDLKTWRQSSEGVGERIFAADGTAFVQKLRSKRQHGGFEELEEIQSVERLWEAELERQVSGGGVWFARADPGGRNRPGL